MSNEQTAKIELPKRRTRSPGYPSTNLEDALTKAQIVWENDGRNECPLVSLAQQWGFAAQSSSAAQLSAALKKFGLFVDVEGKNAHVKLADSAMRIFANDDPASPERIELIKKAALSPQIYRDLWEKYKGDLPSDSTIKTYLIADLEFNPASVDKFLEDFRHTITFAKLTGSDKFQVKWESEESENTGKNMPEPTVTMTLPPRRGTTDAPQTPPPPLSKGIKEMRFELDSGPAVVRYPMSQDDYELLIKSLDLWKKKLVQP